MLIGGRLDNGCNLNQGKCTFNNTMPIFFSLNPTLAPLPSCFRSELECYCVVLLRLPYFSSFNVYLTQKVSFRPPFNIHWVHYVCKTVTKGQEIGPWINNVFAFRHGHYVNELLSPIKDSKSELIDRWTRLQVGFSFLVRRTWLPYLVLSLSPAAASPAQRSRSSSAFFRSGVSVPVVGVRSRRRAQRSIAWSTDGPTTFLALTLTLWWYQSPVTPVPLPPTPETPPTFLCPLASPRSLHSSHEWRDTRVSLEFRHERRDTRSHEHEVLFSC